MSQYCDVCSLPLQDDNALQGHLIGKKHLRKLQQVDNWSKTILVSPLTTFLPKHKLINTFQSYGTIKWYLFRTNDVIIQFDSREPTDILLNKPLWINGIELTIKRKSNDDDVPKACADPTSYHIIKHTFEKGSNFDDQLMAFLNAVQLSDAEIETRYHSICPQLDAAFNGVYPKCKTYKFGSTQMGLGFKECDLDIYMDTGEDEPMEQIFRKVKRILYRMDSLFSNIVSIPKAKTPIIKFQHVPTNVSCDISFMNGLAVHKTALMKYYISLDARLRPLMMLIKYWAKHSKISGSGKISNYALILLFVFFLQQPPINILPPVIELQKNCKPVNGWQVNFDRNTILPPINNSKSIPELLHDFFCFYSTFDFKSYVICPVDGIAHAKSEFLQPERLPVYLDMYKMCVGEEDKNKFSLGRLICIQDPIELCHNVTPGTLRSTVRSLVHYCTVGATVCASTRENGYKDLMKMLFSVVQCERHNIRISIADYYKGIQTSKSSVHFEDTQKFKDPWYLTVVDMVKDVFDKVFKFQLEGFVTDKVTGQRNVIPLTDALLKKLPEIHCTGKHCVWRNRVYDSCILDPSLSALEKEAIISDQTILKTRADTGTTDDVILDFTCSVTKIMGKGRLEITLTNVNGDDKVLNDFVCFAKMKLSSIINNTLIHKLRYDRD